MITTICCFFSFLVEAVILWQYASTLFVPKCRAKTRFICLCIFYLILFAVSLFDFKWLNASLYLFVNFLFLFLCCRLKWHLAFFHSAVLTAVMALCELAVYSIIGHFAPHFFTETASAQNIILFGIFSKMIFFTVIYILMHFFKERREYSQKHDKYTLLLVFIPLTSVYVMLTFVAVSDACTPSPALIFMVTLGAVFLLFTNLLVFGINQYNQKKNMEFTEMQLLLQKEANAAEYYAMLLSQNENQNILIHDIKKHLQSIRILNDKKEYGKISAYIEQLLLSSDLQESARLCDHELLNAILCRYKRKCNSSLISFHADIRHGTIDFIADNDLTSLFCNLLDNALEAARGIPDAFVEINTGKRTGTPFIVISVINSSRTNPFTDSQDSLTSHKPDKRGHGFGIKSIRKAVSKYHGDMQMYYHDDTLTFHTVITLKSSVQP